jgi:hypothetical protein
VYRIRRCSFCDWQSTTGTDADAFSHLEEHHDLTRFRRLDDPEN